MHTLRVYSDICTRNYSTYCRTVLPFYALDQNQISLSRFFYHCIGVLSQHVSLNLCLCVHVSCFLVSLSPSLYSLLLSIFIHTYVPLTSYLLLPVSVSLSVCLSVCLSVPLFSKPVCRVCMYLFHF